MKSGELSDEPCNFDSKRVGGRASSGTMFSSSTVPVRARGFIFECPAVEEPARVAEEALMLVETEAAVGPGGGMS